MNSKLLYLTDNGGCRCQKHLGETARATGRDLSGQELLQITPEMLRELGDSAYCELCPRYERP